MKLIQAYIESNRFGELIGMDFRVEKPGIVHYSITIDKKHLATPSAAHGGVLAALADAGLGVGALSAVSGTNEVVSTMELSLSYFRPVLLGDKLVATSTPLKIGKSNIFMELEIINQNGVLVAKGTGIFNRYPAEKAGFVG